MELNCGHNSLQGHLWWDGVGSLKVKRRDTKSDGEQS